MSLTSRILQLRLLAALCSLMTVTAASAVAAQGTVEAPPERGSERVRTPLPLRLTERPLTLPRGKVAVGSTLGVGHQRSALDPLECVPTTTGEVCFDAGRNGRDTFGHSSSGFAIGVIDAVEIGLLPIAYRNARSAEGGTEIHFFDPELSLRATAITLERFQLGFGYRLALPLRSDSTFLWQRVSLDLLSRSRVVRVFGSAFVDFASPIRDSLSRRVISPGIDVGVAGQVSEPVALFLSLRSYFFDSTAEGHQLSMRVGVVGSFRRPDGQALADLSFAVAAVDLIHPDEGATRPIDPTEPSMGAPYRLYTFDLSATFYFHDAW